MTVNVDQPLTARASAVRIEAQGSVFVMRLADPMLRMKKRRRVRRGQCNGFNRGCRRRMLERFGRLKYHGLTVFLTLTSCKILSPFVAKQCLDRFLKRVRRRFPQASGIWRMERQKRGAPHFHLVLFNLPKWDKREVQRVWGEVIEEEKPFTRIEGVDSWGRVIGYVAKYVSKADPAGEGPRSRPVGGGETPAGVSVGSSLLHNSPQEGEGEKGSGRWWGIFNRKALPFGHLHQIEAEAGQWVFRMKRVARRRGVPSSRRRLAGFTVLRAQARQWLRCLGMFYGDDVPLWTEEGELARDPDLILKLAFGVEPM